MAELLVCMRRLYPPPRMVAVAGGEWVPASAANSAKCSNTSFTAFVDPWLSPVLFVLSVCRGECSQPRDKPRTLPPTKRSEMYRSRVLEWLSGTAGQVSPPQCMDFESAHCLSAFPDTQKGCAMTAGASGGLSPFGALLLRHRAAAGLTQEELAARADALKLEAPERAQLEAAARANEVSPRSRPTGGADGDAHHRSRWLAVEPTPLVDRVHELDTIIRSLVVEDARLLTLTGPAGVGKTRLAAARLAQDPDRFPDGIAVVDLAPVRDPALVPEAIARGLGLLDVSSRPALRAPDGGARRAAAVGGAGQRRAGAARRRNLAGRPLGGLSAAGALGDQPRAIAAALGANLSRRALPGASSLRLFAFGR